MSSLEIPFSWYRWGKRKSEKNNVGITQSLSVHWSKLTDSDDNTGLNIFFNLLEWTSLVLSVCFMQFKEWVFLLNWFYLLIPGAVWGTQSLDVRCKFLKHILKALRIVPNSLRSENCYHWGKSFPCLNQSEQRIGGPWEVSKLYTSK